MDPARMEWPAVFSPDRVYRYTLRRVWAPEWREGGLYPPPRSSDFVAFIGLNPSTADETEDDPTVRRCIGYAKRWGYGGMFMLNIFSFRNTDPRELYRMEDPVGPWNDFYITRVIQKSEVALVVACWGNHGALLSRGWSMFRLVKAAGVDLFHLGSLTMLGQPWHPLYLKGDLKPEKL